MGLFDFFSSGGTRRGTQQGIASLNAGMSDADKRLQEASAGANMAIDRGEAAGIDAIGTGFGAARNEYQNARGEFAPWIDQGLKGFNLYADALGANGGEGFDRATGAFRNSPGYEKMVADATDAVARKQGAIGALASGNTMAAITDRASNLADREYTGWLGNLDNLGKVGYAAQGQSANLTKGIGDLFANQGTAEAGVYGTAANSRVNNALTIGQAGANNQINTSRGIADLQFKNGQAQDAASGNIWGALLGAGNLASRVVTAPMNNGSLLSGWLR